MEEYITSIDALTPIERRGDYYFKREDLYRPFAFSPVNGSKCRQCQLLVDKNWDKACKGLVTGTSVLSPQAAIVASVAKSLSVRSVIMYGGTTVEGLKRHKYPTLCQSLGSDVRVVSKMGYTTVVNDHARRMAQEEGLFHVRYGFDLADTLDVFVDSVSLQCANIPSDVTEMVITVGSAITLLGVLVGLCRYPNNISKIYCVGCAPNRLQKIYNYADMIYFQYIMRLPIEKIEYIDAFNTIKGYKYENTMNASYEGIVFHPRYEAKTFHWLRNQSLKNVLFWITGSDF